MNNNHSKLCDFGDNPFSTNIDMLTLQNQNFRTALWTGKHLQLVAMSIKRCESIGGEVHPKTDQFIRIVKGRAEVEMGKCADNITYSKQIGAGDITIIPAGCYHNIKNIGECSLKLYTIYAPPEHPKGTVNKTKEDAEKHEHHRH